MVLRTKKKLLWFSVDEVSVELFITYYKSHLKVKFAKIMYSIVQMYCKCILPKLTTFLGFSEKKLGILNGSKFSMKSHDNSQSLLFPTTCIFKGQFVWNEK